MSYGRQLRSPRPVRDKYPGRMRNFRGNFNWASDDSSAISGEKRAAASDSRSRPTRLPALSSTPPPPTSHGKNTVPWSESSRNPRKYVFTRSLPPMFAVAFLFESSYPLLVSRLLNFNKSERTFLIFYFPLLVTAMHIAISAQLSNLYFSTVVWLRNCFFSK